MFPSVSCKALHDLFPVFCYKFILFLFLPLALQIPAILKDLWFLEHHTHHLLMLFFLLESLSCFPLAPLPGKFYQTRHQTQVFYVAGGFFTSWATRETQEYWSGYPIPSPVDLPNPGIEPEFPALQVDSLPTELLGKPWKIKKSSQMLWNGWTLRTCYIEEVCYKRTNIIMIPFM